MPNGKQRVAEELAAILPVSGPVGVGTGSTVDLTVRAWVKLLGARLSDVLVVATSQATEILCRELGLAVLGYEDERRLPIVFDGADQVDGRRAIKGGGGAMRREKTVALRGDRVIFAVDAPKLVTTLGAGCAIPVEVDPACIKFVSAALKQHGATETTVRICRGGIYGPVVTELGCVIIDALFSEIPAGLDVTLKGIHGVFATGLFETVATEIWVGHDDRVERLSCR